MAKWRAKIKLPKAADTALRNHCSAKPIKLQDGVHELLDIGISRISQSGTRYQFRITNLLNSPGTGDCEYVVEDTYKSKLQTQVHLLEGRGKQGKIFAECILIGLEQKGINW